MKNKYTTITYASDYFIDKETGIKLPFIKNKKVVITSVRRFNNCLHKTASLPSSARNLLDYIIQKMSRENEIENSFLFRQDYLEMMSSNCGIKYAVDTVNKGFQVLKQNNILISFDKKRGVYIVNPMFFFCGTDYNRKKLLQKMLNATPDGKYKDTNLKSAMGL